MAREMIEDGWSATGCGGGGGVHCIWWEIRCLCMYLTMGSMFWKSGRSGGLQAMVRQALRDRDMEWKNQIMLVVY